MNMLMKPQALEAKYFCPIKGYESSAEEVVGIMKNSLYNLCMSGPINVPDFFFRTLVDAAQNPHILKPYTPWIMKLICTKTGYQPDRPNHRTYLTPVQVLQLTISSNDKGKGIFYDHEDQPTKSLGGNI